jgi:hypothetical protein
MAHLPEKHESLWPLTLSPVLWAAHFLASYITVAIWCAKVAGRDGALGGARVAIAVYTAAALAGIGLAAWSGYRRHSHGDASTPHDADTPEDRHRFLGFATLLLSALSAVATLYTAMAAYFVETCH